jgi:NodT family efflux transporter outer membrane factor (OMF) lipoprotein
MPRPFLLIPTLLLAGCIAKSPPPDAQLTADALPPGATPAGRFTAAGNADPGTVTDGWLKSFNDARLDALVADAMAFNRDLAASKARVDQAAATARQAGADLKPQVGYALGASAAGTGGSSAHTDQMGAGLTLSWELDVWGRLSSAQRAAQEQYASQAADFAFARQSLAAQVAKAYFLAIQAVNQEAIAVEFAALQKQSAELTALREAGGRSSKYDLALARSAASTAEDQVRQAQSGRERAVRSLELLVGRYPKAELPVGATLPAMPGPPPAGLPSQLLERRPDLVAATRRVAAAFNQVESAKAARLPRLSLTADVGTASQSLRDLSLNDVFWNIAGNLVGPIFDGGRLQEQVVIETARQQEALALYGKAALSAFQQVEQGLAEEHRLLDRVALVGAADQDQREALHLATLKFDAGTIDQLALLLVQGNALNTRLADLSVRVERLTNRVDLHLALGGGFEPPPPAPEDSQPASKVIAK